MYTFCRKPPGKNRDIVHTRSSLHRPILRHLPVRSAAPACQAALLQNPVLHFLCSEAFVEGKAMAMVWSTDEVPPPERLAYWTEVICRTLVPVDCIARADRPFFSRIETDVLGPIRVSVASGAVQVASRQARRIDREPQEDFTLLVHGFGTASFQQLGRDSLLGPGDIVLHDMNRPFEFNFAADWMQTILMFPRAALLSRIGDAGSHLGLKMDKTVGMAGMLSSLLGSLPKHLHCIPDHARDRVADNLLDLIATAILASSDRPFESSRMTLTRVKLWIERHLSDALSAEIIATQCGLSSRHLNRLFAVENTSLMQFVLDRRLARCHRDLTDPAMRGRSITDIALSAGFSDLSHFSRTYRAHFGCSPRETRLGLPRGATDAPRNNADEDHAVPPGPRRQPPQKPIGETDAPCTTKVRTGRWQFTCRKGTRKQGIS